MTRLVFGGTAPEGEIFQWGFWVNGTVTNAADATALAVAVHDIFVTTAVRTNLCVMIRPDSTYSFVKAYCYPGGGPTAEFVGEANLDHIGGGIGTGTDSAPLYQCAVIQTQTGLSGRSNRGRFYLPASGFAVFTNHRYTTSQTGNTIAAVKALMDAVNNITSPFAARCVVLSQLHAHVEPITSIRMDSKPDVQRRRENRMPSGAGTSGTIVP